MDDEPAIIIEGLYKGFGDHPIIRDLHLKVGKGRVLVIFGCNGSGKTTLLNLLATKYKPDRGEIWVNGISRRVNPLAVRRGLGMVAHQAMLYEGLTCSENLKFFGKMYDLPRLPDRINEVLNWIGLESRRDQKVGTLSNGMRKRLAIGRAIIHDPSIVLMDEPETGLDAGGLERIKKTLLVNSVHERTLVITTHNIEFGMDWANDVAVLADGQISHKVTRRGLDRTLFRDTFLRGAGGVV